MKKIYSLKIFKLIAQAIFNIKAIYILAFTMYIFAAATNLSNYQPTPEETEKYKYLFEGIALFDTWFSGLPFVIRLVIFLIPLAIFLFYQLITMILPMLLKYYKLSVKMESNKLIISKGFGLTKTTIIPLTNIIGFRIRQSLLNRIFGLGTIEIISISNRIKKNSIVHFLARKEALGRFLQKFCLQPKDNLTIIKPPRDGQFQFLFIPILITMISLYLFDRIILLLLPIVILSRSLCFLSTGIYADNNTIKIINGGLTKKTTFIYSDKLISVTTTQNPFQKLQGVYHYKLFIFGFKRPIKVANLFLTTAPFCSALGRIHL